MDGFLNMLKPPGMSSNDLVCFVRRRLPRGTRVGHGGTLDPDAAGVLPVCVGRAARLFDYIIDKQKTYIAELKLGVETDTQDASGAVVARSDASRCTAKDVRAVLPGFTGEIDQIPPAYSAIKRDGKRMYALARRGEAIELEARRVRVDSIDYLQPAGRDAHLICVRCGKGVYIRTLCHDIGRALGVGAHMAFLLRSQAGCFDVQNSVTPEEFAAAAEENRIEPLLFPLDAPLGHIPPLTINPAYEKQALNGVPMRPEWLDGRLPPGIMRLYLKGVFAGIGEMQADGLIRFKAMLWEKN